MAYEVGRATTASNTPLVYPVAESRQEAVYRAAQAPRPADFRASQPSRRNWTKTALVIGGSTATGAGVGAIVGGKKGALVGAAIGGGGSTLYEATRR
jgi:hypothetical protein